MNDTYYTIHTQYIICHIKIIKLMLL